MSCEIAAQSNKNDCALLDKNVLTVQSDAEKPHFFSTKTVDRRQNAQRHGNAMALLSAA
ncbi:hypothetical protein L7P61_01935 [Aeromonas veronii bv. sobria]|uniref:hypothetical protein n=1 Tax=Aeromonas veronii TaxID=654 RepID=UPI00132B2DB4|nr:hypothetical protein [Aeromonas veronii]MCR3958557.1 hypothetical protein [Aeromonas veronii]MXV28321.1 hypothetical protein [Aeromonas veronii]